MLSASDLRIMKKIVSSFTHFISNFFYIYFFLHYSERVSEPGLSSPFSFGETSIDKKE